ncbi:RDD family protein [Campylobacter geochelonis]|uniref:RDD protein n=1 Tax=Campylobacter geochelonis TaxID=1780362 RepID=A0A128ECK0_9BACT|nr:RDD family protein [Campylobacter geochelonis]QKF70362.1 RDD family membrane protein [Campylobacter geochelonis]CZE46191.1 RDD protein [Campylobacter geochelonis]CZE46438.1 RDD protein [Campylobacter geochelonis]CZE50754.1 RDD protein [Campylobacter geochelonis]
MSKQKASISPVFLRVKAFVLDMFLIAIPLLYFTTYVVLDGKDNFQHNQLAIFAVWLVYGLITSLFFTFKAQTPGYKAQEIYLIDLKTGKKITFIKAVLRYVIFVFFGPVGIVFCLFRKDRLNLHDILTQSAAVIKK